MKKERNVSSGNYPYINARVRGMKSKLIKKEDYEKLLHMGLEEFIHFLEESDYKKEIDFFAMHRSGCALAEFAVAENFSKTMKKLKSISKGTDVNTIVRGYLKRWSIWNIKIIVRGKYAGESPETIKSCVLDLSDPKVNIDELVEEKVTIEDVMEKTGLTRNCSRMIDSIKLFREKNSLSYLENCLDWYYYSLITEFAKRIPAQESFIRKFIEKEVDTLNIKIILKMKREKFLREEILKNIIRYRSARGKLKTWDEFVNAPDMDSLLELFSKTSYWPAMEPGVKDFKESNRLSMLESGLEKHVLEHAFLLLHQQPLSISPIIGYMIAKRVEMKNLGMLARSKEVSLDEDFMRRHLVIAGA
ncbi:MAG: V-type ATPase subunit [Candidatus Diapherotrites archaeon]|nr:V-type ATPase subunit [Candidatus Diapherotrites archaeon]